MVNQNYSIQNQNLTKQIPVLPSKPELFSVQQPYQIDPNRTALFPGNVFSHRSINYKLVALTFDDAPDSLFAPVLLDVLMHYDVKVTFFSLGRCAHQNPDMVKRMVDEGHIIGNHTYDHLDITKIPADQVREQVQRTEDEIYRIVGLRTALFRPPFGFLNDESTRVVLSLGYKIILWNIDSFDWMGLTGPAIASRVIVNITPGAIVLMHNACDGSVASGTGTVQSLPFIIETLKAEGYIFTTIDMLLNIPPYK
jgi:peptidoglycan-N-acetylglucosamine deacetylase